MSLSATLKRDSADGTTVRYVDSYGGRDAFLAEAVVLRASDLPDPPPALLRITLSWYQAPAGADAETAGLAGEPTGAVIKHSNVQQGDRVEIVKSKVSGVKNPPVWLEQHLGKTGIVLWTTADGANVDLGGEAVWFAYDELKPQA